MTRIVPPVIDSMPKDLVLIGPQSTAVHDFRKMALTNSMFLLHAFEGAAIWRMLSPPGLAVTGQN